MKEEEIDVTLGKIMLLITGGIREAKNQKNGSRKNDWGISICFDHL